MILQPAGTFELVPIYIFPFDDAKYAEYFEYKVVFSNALRHSASERIT